MLGDPGLCAPLLSRADSVRWVQSTWAGVNTLYDGCDRRDYACTRLAGVFGPLMAEYCMAHILWQSRGFTALADAQKAKARRHWQAASLGVRVCVYVRAFEHT